ncbi:MAG: peptidoglycan bridge formation glycyltransferase FemA/FemB family protein [Anaerolineaceae bacterium]|nr:peptidoglycan bridge formation glycyltransferase FemA/FemB family protein [Anaerolineaceae bacterium]
MNSSQNWNAFLSAYPDAHILQSSAWGTLKACYGWESVSIVKHDIGAQILFKKLPLGFHVAYIPKGPVGSGDWNVIWPEIDQVCKSKRTIFLSVEPDLLNNEHDKIKDFFSGFEYKNTSVQPRSTMLLDLRGDQESWLKNLKQKTRYNIRLAIKKGIEISESHDIDAFTRLMKVTGERDQFGVHVSSYYEKAFELFQEGQNCALLLAKYGDKVLAGLMVFRRGNRAWYLFGGSSNEERNRMPTYLLQWEAMRWAARQGCGFYDLWGVPDQSKDVLEEQFKNRSDGLWSVYRFKRGFNGEIVRFAGTWVRVYMPLIYKLYELWESMRI